MGATSDADTAAKWLEAFVLVGIDERDAAKARDEQRVYPPGILACYPETARRHIPPQLSVCCLPLGVRVTRLVDSDLRSEQYTAVLTDSRGNKSFVFCLAFDAPCPAEHSSGDEALVETKCLCVITKIPLHATIELLLKELYRNGLREFVSLGQEGMVLKEVWAKLSSLPCSPSCPVHAMLPFGRACLNLEFAIPADYCAWGMRHIQSIVDLNPSILVTLFKALLLECKIMLRSASNATLSNVAEALCDFLYPLKWQHIYIPILPEQLIEYVEAPTPYLMGVNTCIPTDSYIYDESIEIDFDHGRIIRGEGLLPHSELLEDIHHRLKGIMRRLDGLPLGGNRARRIERETKVLFADAVKTLLDRCRLYFRPRYPNHRTTYDSHAFNFEFETDRLFSDTEEDDPNDLQFWQSFTDTQMFQNFFQASPELCAEVSFKALFSELESRHSLVEKASSIGGESLIVTFQSSEHLDMGLIVRNEHRMPDRSETREGKEKYAEGGNEEAVQQLCKIVDQYVRSKYGDLLGNVGECMEEHLRAESFFGGRVTDEVCGVMIDVLFQSARPARMNKRAICELASDVITCVLESALAASENQSVLAMILTALRVDRSKSFWPKARILEAVPRARVFWEAIIGCIGEGSGKVSSKETYELLADVSLLHSLIFPDSSWWNGPLSEIARDFIAEGPLSSKDLKVLELLSRRTYDFEVRQSALRNLSMVREHDSSFTPSDACLKASSCAPEALQSSAPVPNICALQRSPVTSIVTASNLVVFATHDGGIYVSHSDAAEAGSKASSSAKLVSQTKAEESIVSINEDASRFFVLGSSIGIWDGKTLQNVRTFKVKKRCTSGCVRTDLTDKMTLVTGNEEGCCQIWDHLSSSHSANFLSFKGHSQPVTQISFLESNENNFFSTSEDGTAVVWDMRNNTSPVYRIKAHRSWITEHAVFNLNGCQYAITGSLDWSSKVWNLETGNHVKTLHGNCGPVHSVAAFASVGSHDKVAFLSGHGNGSASLWKGDLIPDEEPDVSMACAVQTWNSPVLKVSFVDGNPDAFFVCHTHSHAAVWSASAATKLVPKLRASLGIQNAFTACAVVPTRDGAAYIGCANGDVIPWRWEGGSL